MIPDNEISVCPEYEVEYSVKICEIDPYFYEHYNKKIRTDKNGRAQILFRIDV